LTYLTIKAHKPLGDGNTLLDFTFWIFYSAQNAGLPELYLEVIANDQESGISKIVKDPSLIVSEDHTGMLKDENQRA